MSMEHLNQFALAFIPIFVAMDPIGIMPIYISFTGSLSEAEKKRATLNALLTATIFGLLFLLVGGVFFKVIGITADDFKIAGGLLLLILSIQDIMRADKPQRKPGPDFGVVPLGIPLIVGPAVLTTELMLLDIHGVYITSAALIANIALAGISLFSSKWVRGASREGAIKAVSKIVSLLLAAMAVMMIRSGLQAIIATA